ncbi:hypothetical protein ACFSHT_30375 [Paraburkholderia silviterrae]|uniref:Uncharacterized protein n=1 Tax=Paraburkholderia silviterrae TaxID=2528715 RepID=A0A4R5LZK9_9BURK|nr:hypothetical protein [Paraburkholderia silviterrae]TDG18128.1 hypothetical protein EYW47_35770 [Paraburkholderia silviterrae]
MNIKRADPRFFCLRRAVALAICSSSIGLLAGCGGGGSDSTTGSTGGAAGGTPSNGTGPSSGVAAGQSFATNETGEINATLTASQPRYVNSSPLTVSASTQVWAFSWAQYAADFWIFDANNAQIFQSGGAATGYRMAPSGQSGMNFVTIPAGTWYVGIGADQVTSTSYSNPVYAELDAVSLPGASLTGNTPMDTGVLNPGGWKTQPFTVSAGTRGYIETEGPGGTFAVMSTSQASSFTSTFANGFTQGQIPYTYACGNGSGAANLEIECEMQLPAGNYVLVYINTSSSPSGGAANVAFYK